MILATARGRHAAIASAEQRAADWSGFYPPPSAATRGITSAGVPFGVEVPAIACAVRLVSETIAGFVMRTYRGVAEQRQPVHDTWQAELFQDPAPDEYASSFTLWEDVVTSIELYSGAFLRKLKARGRVVALEVLDPECMRVSRAGGPHGPRRVEGWVDRRRVDLTDEVIYIRGFSPIPAAAEGVGTTRLHRSSIRGARDYEEFRGRYFASDATPGIVLTHPGNPTAPQRTEILRAWVRRHSGPQGRLLPGMVWGGMGVQQLQATMRDSQATELADAIVRDVAREFRIFPPALLHAAVDSNAGIVSAEATADMFMRFSLQGRMRRIERALAADTDLFPDRSMYPRFDTTEFTRGDIATMASKVHQLVQVGVMSPNEGRSELGYPPHPDGDQLQITPVGGAPNPEPPAT